MLRHRARLFSNNDGSTTPESLPSALAGLKAWGEGSSLGADGSAVASWTNLTGSGLDPAQATSGSRPTVKANAINGQKAVEFTAASSQYLSFPAGSLGWFNNATGGVIAVVYQPKSVGTLRWIVQASRGSAVGNIRFGNGFLATNSVRCGMELPDSTARSANATSTVGVGTPYIGTSLGLCSTSGMSQAAFNGAVQGSSTATTPQNFTASDSLAITIGSDGTPANFADGYLAAYAIWNVPYTITQLRPVLRRWARIYGITLL